MRSDRKHALPIVAALGQAARLREPRLEMPRILVSAIDASGDTHAAKVVRALRTSVPEAAIFEPGGSALVGVGVGVGVKIHVPHRNLAMAGLFEALAIRPDVRRARRRLEIDVTSSPIDLALLSLRPTSTSGSRGARTDTESRRFAIPTLTFSARDATA